MIKYQHGDHRPVLRNRSRMRRVFESVVKAGRSSL